MKPLTAALRDPVKRGYLAMAVFAAFALLVAGPLLFDRDARHLTAYREGDEDVARVVAEMPYPVEAALASPTGLADVEAPEKTAFVAIGVERRYSATEVEAIVDFLRRGGRVVLADETGYGTDVAKAAGFAFSSTPLLDTSNHLGDPRLVVALARTDGGQHRVVFNAPSVVVPLPDARPHEVLAASSKAEYPDGSYLDVNGNGEIDLNDPAPAETSPGFPLVVRTQVGDGVLVLVSDTGLFMDRQARIPEFENAAFVRALLGDMLPGDGEVLLDESRHAPTAAVAWWAAPARQLARVTQGLAAPLAALAVLTLLTVLAYRAMRETEDWSHHKFDVAAEVPLPPAVRPDHARAQRMARRRISEKYNIPMEQLAAMTSDQLLAVTGDRLLSEAAAGQLRADPGPVFRSFASTSPRADALSQEATP